MKAYLKNPNFYYMLAPAAAALWIVFVMSVSLPAAEKRWTKTQTDFNRAQDLIARIIALDPDRLQYKTAKGGSSKFDYSTAIQEIATLVKIPPSNYSLVARRPVRSGGKEKRSADVTISTVDIETLAKFISQMLLRWSDLECDLLSIDRLSTGKNNWKATMKFTYAPK